MERGPEKGDVAVALGEGADGGSGGGGGGRAEFGEEPLDGVEAEATAVAIWRERNFRSTILVLQGVILRVDAYVGDHWRFFK